MKSWILRLALVFFLLALFYFGQPSTQHSLFSQLQESLGQWHLLVSEAPLVFGLVFFLIYVLATGLSIPGAVGFMFVAGGLFGWAWGVVLSSFATSLGALLAFLLFRTLLPGWATRKFPRQIGGLRDLLSKSPQREAELLFLLRLFPVVPYFLVNIAFSFGRLSPWKFYWLSQVGMLPATLLYVSAGQELARAGSVEQLISPPHLLLFLALALVPAALRFIGKRFLPKIP